METSTTELTITDIVNKIKSGSKIISETLRLLHQGAAIHLWNDDENTAHLTCVKDGNKYFYHLAIQALDRSEFIPLTDVEVFRILERVITIFYHSELDYLKLSILPESSVDNGQERIFTLPIIDRG